MTFLSEASETMAGHILTACNLVRDLQNFLQNSYISFFKAKLCKTLRLFKLFKVKRCVRIVRKVDGFLCKEVVHNNKFIAIDKTVVAEAEFGGF